jgi:hypothetical protein
MKMNLGTLNTHEINSTGSKEKKMHFSEDSQSIIFQMFSKNIYSNPIGSVVREITSNCFDSHVEAGVATPVLIKKSYDAASESHFISFIDFGVGMSPERINNVYSVYFQSTKRADNTQIGGFGLGSKSVLAYRRQTGLGENEYDNSFFVITVYNGIKYTYCIYEGNESPVINEMFSEPTDEHNGTEVKIPVLEKDIQRFEAEMISQLYYFENIVFEGFNGVTNDYKIVQGKTFLYRGEGVDSYIHVCLGRVAYPINYNVLGLSRGDYDIPVAIKLNIGDVMVNASRENLDYSDATIKLLKRKVEEVKKELTEMLTKQYEDITTLEQYYNVKNNFGRLIMPNGGSIDLGEIVDKDKVSFNNFPYKDLDMLKEIELFNTFFEVRMYGKNLPKHNRYRYSDEIFNHTIESLRTLRAMYFVEDDLTRKIVKQAYLKSLHPTRYYVMIPHDLSSDITLNTICNKFDIHYDVQVGDTTLKTGHTPMTADEARTIVECFRDELMDIVRKYAVDYESVEVPQDFIDHRKAMRLSREELKGEFVLKTSGDYNRRGSNTIKVENFLKFNGKIFYGFKEDEDAVNNARRLFEAAFKSSSKIVSLNGYKRNFSNKHGIAFITISKMNEKYMKFRKNTYNISEFYHRMFYRKAEMLKKNTHCQEVTRKYNNIHELYKKNGFNLVSKTIAREMGEIKNELNTYGSPDTFRYVNLGHYLISKHIDLYNVAKDKKMVSFENKLDKYVTLTKTNEQVLRFINIPYNPFDMSTDHCAPFIDMLNKVLTF